MINIGVIGSTKGTDLQAILDSIKSGNLDANISIVISNRAGAYILKRAQNHGIPSVFIDHKDRTRKEFDSAMTKVLKENKVDLVLLIGFMRILSSKFCNDWEGKILNVHPSLLPKYVGGMDTNVHEEVLRNKDKETGCTIHFVTNKVDGGPILIQKRCLVEPDDTVESLKSKVQKLEGEAFLEAIPMFNNNG
jgi:formyltetrahydrofolate-dependent phosphoribosylglycinamide formyltransferase